jgi:RHS repeat-associated protein
MSMLPLAVAALLSTAQVALGFYHPFGSIPRQTGPLPYSNAHRFSSREFHAASSLLYCLPRFDDPSSQRWINRDPLGEHADLNLHRFNYNNPANLVDPDGQSPQGAIIGGGAGALAGGIVGGGIGSIGVVIPPLAPITIAIGADEGAIIGGVIGGWLGSLLPSRPIVCENRGHGERGIQGNDPNPWKGYRPKDPNDPSKGGLKRDPQTGKWKPVPRPEGPPPPNHPTW